MSNSSNQSIFFIGTYSVPGPYFTSNGEGLHSFALNEETGTITALATYDKVPNPTYITKHPSEPLLFVAIDRYLSPGEIMACDIDLLSGSVTPRSSQTALGTATCHVGINSTSTLAAVASYVDGKLTLHQLDGSEVSPHFQHFQYEGNSVNVDRQEAAHAHQAVFSPCDRWLYVADLGSDKVWIHDSTDLAAPPRSASVPAGYGPRHLVCHPSLPLIYLFCELNAILLTYARDAETGSLTLISEASSLPKDFDGEPAGAAIRLHPSCKTLYVSNRNHHSISVFTLSTDGSPNFYGFFFTGGHDPRDFNFSNSGRWLIAANQNSEDITSFPIDATTGLPLSDKPAHTLPCGTPVCVQFI